MSTLRQKLVERGVGVPKEEKNKLRRDNLSEANRETLDRIMEKGLQDPGELSDEEVQHLDFAERERVLQQYIYQNRTDVDGIDPAVIESLKVVPKIENILDAQRQITESERELQRLRTELTTFEEAIKSLEGKLRTPIEEKQLKGFQESEVQRTVHMRQQEHIITQMKKAIDRLEGLHSEKK